MNLLDGSFLSGGIVLVLLGGFLAYFRSLFPQIWEYLKAKVVITVDTVKGDVFFDWLDIWMSDQAYTKQCRRLSVVSRREQRRLPQVDDGDNRGREWNVDVVPAPGEHLFRYKGRLVWLHKERERLSTDGNFRGYFETATLSFVTRDRNLVYSFLSEVRDHAINPDDNRIAVYVNRWNDWRLFSMMALRPPDTVVLDGNKMQTIIQDVERFFSMRDWYTKYSIPFRRGYLLYGPPGNGKSSAIAAVASHLGWDLYVMSITRGMGNMEVMDLFLSLPDNAILLIEDIDQALGAKPPKDEGEDRITKSGLLNTLDGAVATTGRIIFMTTNFLGALDDALVRPGRIDVIYHIGEPTDGQIDAYLSRFLDTDAIQVIKAGLDGDRSIAKLQEEVIQNGAFL